MLTPKPITFPPLKLAPPAPRPSARPSAGPRTRLAVVLSLGAVPLDDQRAVLTKKVIEGMSFYAEQWQAGETVAFMTPIASETDNLDNVEVDLRSLPFRVEVLPFGGPEMMDKLGDAAVVLGGPLSNLRGLSGACRARGVPSVYNTEYSLTTRLQIVRSGGHDRVRTARKLLWEVNEEFRHLRRELRLADGVQCNGTPTYEAYKDLTPSPFLYFDSRVTAAEVASEEDLARANRRRAGDGPLRLAFSGRLNAMKGAGDLVDVALALRRRHVPFEMSIFGDGVLGPEMRQRIDAEGLAGEVKLEGVLDFHGELLPRLRDEVDLFVCCHVQGDPSCTYLETLAAGVPIVGYANEAFAGLCARARVGWATPLHDPEALAEEIAHLNGARVRLVECAREALAFAGEHTFESTFRRRVEHLREVADRAAQGSRDIPVALPIVP